MEEHKLTRQDFRDMFQAAHREWLNSDHQDEQLVLCKIYVKVFCGWLAGNELNVIKGKVVKDE